ncbi:hypothetical protein GLYMA_06G121050v4 [Glycine max]|nr:hypothetical protein GLYMA_06G121050v4 [Glycine max]KAG4389607.1 hypothetical protein GLYMA_06G121050v4 [Glycine max]KAH1125481.1 hypothetical protein GYH30_014859 [Glycine max]KAH1125482.1 hypothetical protein GYH30_014859 [Glycine max]
MTDAFAKHGEIRWSFFFLLLLKKKWLYGVN